MASAAAAIPLGTPSHLQDLFGRLYSSYSRDPLTQPAISWALGPGGVASLEVSGVTATLYLSLGGMTTSAQYNLANDGNGNRPTLGTFSSWLATQLQTFFFVSGPYVSAVMSDAPVGYWKLNETTGTTAADSSGHGQSGTIGSGVTFSATSPFSDMQTMAFNGGGVISLPTLSSLPSTGPYTVEAWVRSISFPCGVFSYGNTVVTDKAFNLLFGGAGDITVDWVNDSFDSFSTNIAFNNWYHIATVWDGTSRISYVNGVAVATQAHAGAPNFMTASGGAIGVAVGSGFTRYWSGNLAHVAVYSAALSAARIQAHYQQGTIYQAAPHLVTPSGMASATFGGLSALVIPEGFWRVPFSIPYATSLNYLQMRVMALLFDLMAADSTNLLSQISPATAQGMWLDWIGALYGVPRLTQNSGAVSAETDDAYHGRFSRTLAQPHENNVAIAEILAQTFNIGSVQVTDSGPNSATVWINSSISNPQSVLPVARSLAIGGVSLTGMYLTPGAGGGGAVCGKVRAGTARAGGSTTYSILR